MLQLSPKNSPTPHDFLKTSEWPSLMLLTRLKQLTTAFIKIQNIKTIKQLNLRLFQHCFSQWYYSSVPSETGEAICYNIYKLTELFHFLLSGSILSRAVSHYFIKDFGFIFWGWSDTSSITRDDQLWYIGYRWCLCYSSLWLKLLLYIVKLLAISTAYMIEKF